MEEVMQPAMASGPTKNSDKMVIFASSLGTVFEWYDFYLYGSLAAIISQKFFSGVNETSAFIFALLAFAAGFAIRPFGALFFGRLGDMLGRKYTFLMTIVLMGASTFLVGVLPTYDDWGVTAPIVLLSLRILQGLALGGEYGGAAIYVAEFSPDNKRGFHTAWIQTTATLGFLLSLAVILVTRLSIGEAAFAAWGWRLPFIFSILLLAVSVWIRMSLRESPLFIKMKSQGKTSKAPIKETFSSKANVKLILIALFGIVAGQAVIWYTGQFYALFYLTQILKVQPITANLLLGAALIIGTPIILLCGWLSDKFGRKPILLAGFALSALGFFPLFHALTSSVNPRLAAAIAMSPVTVVADAGSCSFQFNPVGTTAFTSSCDIAKSYLAKSSVNYANKAGVPGETAYVLVGETRVDAYDATGLSPADVKQKQASFSKDLGDLLTSVGYPTKAAENEINYIPGLTCLVGLITLVALVYGPIASTLVELFPMRIRYTAMSLPYHIGNGWFGGFLPTLAFAIVATTGNIFNGLWYPVLIAGMSFFITLFFLPETRGRSLTD